MKCVFCQIAAGTVPARLIFATERCLAFLDHRPLFPGHVLICPRRHARTLVDLLPEEVGPLFEEVRLLARAVPRALGKAGTFVGLNNVVSQSVPHLHVHVVPRQFKDGLKGFFWPRRPYAEGEAEQVVGEIRTCLLQERVLDFWFGPLDEQGAAHPDRATRWFSGGEEFDDLIRQSFGGLAEQALAGELSEWGACARGRLALVILLDQFPRNLHRHAAGSFAGDARALRLCREGVEAGMDRELAADERAFFYLPLEHSEALVDQELSLKLYGRLAQEHPGPRTEQYLRYAQAHHDIIARFGRYPHRNQALGRQSRSEEAAFLREPNSSFW